MKVLKEEDEDRHQQVCTEVRSDGAYVDQGEQDNLIVQKIEGNPRSVGVFGFSYLDENSDKVQGLPMNGIEPTYENISDFSYPGARPLYVYVKKSAHSRNSLASAHTCKSGPAAGVLADRSPVSAWSPAHLRKWLSTSSV